MSFWGSFSVFVLPLKNKVHVVLPPPPLLSLNQSSDLKKKNLWFFHFQQIFNRASEKKDNPTESPPSPQIF